LIVLSLTAVSWGFLGFGMAMVIVSLQIGIGEYVNFLVILMTVILTSIF
jgi:hypothetical protein